MESKNEAVYITKEFIVDPSDKFSRQLAEAIFKYEIIIEQKKVYVQNTETGFGMARVLRVMNLLKGSTTLHFYKVVGIHGFKPCSQLGYLIQVTGYKKIVTIDSNNRML
jgi:hypothetical protein